MASISYKPLPEVVAGVGSFAKENGFRKMGNRFRLALDNGHGLVLIGEDGNSHRDDGYRYSKWWLHVCYRPWADLYNDTWDRPRVLDPLKFDADRHSVVRLTPKPRPTAGPLMSGFGYYPDDPADSEAWIKHITGWLAEFGLPTSLDWLANPRLILDQLFVRRAHYNRDPNSDIWPLQGAAPLGVLISCEIGDLERAREIYEDIDRAAKTGNDFAERWVRALRVVLDRAEGHD